jgi:hypothetical protein
MQYYKDKEKEKKIQRTGNRLLLSVAGLWLVGQKSNKLKRQCFEETTVGQHRHRKAAAEPLPAIARNLIISDNIMKWLAVIILIILSKQLFSQDTTSKIILKPIREMPYQRILTSKEIEAQVDKVIDSIYNCEPCQSLRKKYDSICKANYEKLMIEKRIVENLNNSNSEFYYYLVFECESKDFDWKACKNKHDIVMTSSDSHNCLLFKLEIEKKEKSRLILDGPSGEVFYYEDLRRIPY